MKDENIKSKTYTALACIVGFALTNNLTGLEQNALGNWLYLVAQVLETNYSILQLEEGQTTTTNNKQNKTSFSNDYLDKETINKLKDEIDLIKQELNKLL